MKPLNIVTAITLFLFFACAEKKEGVSVPDPIDREKIDNYFGPATSQLRFDHLYVVLDSLSYAQFLAHADWNASYAAMDTGLPSFKAIDSTATSCYLRGHEHYLEILGPGNPYGEAVGKSGIGFALRNKGEHFHLGMAPKLKATESPYLSMSDTVRMSVGGDDATWFKAFHTPTDTTALHTWYAFYNPAFLDSLLQREHKDYTREALLKDAYDAQRLFKGVAGIQLTCTPDDYLRIAQEMRHLGCPLLSKDGDTLTIGSGDITLTLERDANIAHSTISKIECSLNTQDFKTVQFGNLTISNTGTASSWDFGAVYHKP